MALIISAAISIAASNNPTAHAADAKAETAARAATPAAVESSIPVTPGSAAEMPNENPAAIRNSPAAAAIPVYTVFVPIDEQRRPSGGKVYVPDRMLAELYRAAAAAVDHPSGWLATRAEYRGSLSRDTVQRRLAVSELKGVIDLRVFEPNVVVRLPLDRDSLNLAADGARLDGRPLQPEWDATNAAMSFTVAQPGQYRLELALQPNLQSFGANGGFDLVIPPLTRATVELSVPADGPNLDLPSARGTIKSSRASAIGDALLGPTGRLAVALAGGRRRRRRCSESRSRRTTLGAHSSRFFGDRYSAEISRARRPHAADPPTGRSTAASVAHGRK